jgi:hypothetical protein
MQITAIAALVSLTVTSVSCLIAIVVKFGKIINGQKCLLRSEMLKTYYHNKDSEHIRQYEAENFEKLYEAYKALKGNSFIDKIHNEVKNWEVIS